MTGPAESSVNVGPPATRSGDGGPASTWGPQIEMASSNEMRRRLGVLVARFADEVHREGAETLITTLGVGVSSLTHHLGLLLAGATPSNLATVRPEVVGFGSRVLVQDLGTGETSMHHLMSSSAMDLDEDHVSLESPFGAALLGTTAGDIVDVSTPSGLRSLQVLSVRSLLELLEVLDPQEDLFAGAGR